MISFQGFSLSASLHNTVNPGIYVPKGATDTTSQRDDGAAPFSGSPTMGLWQGSDGKWLATAPTQRKQWPDFCKAVGREDLSDPSLVFKTRGVETIMDELRALFATKPRDEWVDAMVENKVPAAPCTSYAELAEHPQVRANNYIVEVDHPDFPKGKHRVVGIPTCAKQRLSCSIRRRPCYLNLRCCQQNFLRFSRRHSGRGAQAGPAHGGGTGGAGLQ